MAALPCAQEGCDDQATHVVAQTGPLDLLFKSGAGLMCKPHAVAMCEIGGIKLSFEGFIEAIRKEMDE